MGRSIDGDRDWDKRQGLRDRDRYRDSNVTMLYIWSQMFPKGQYVPRFCATVHFTSQGCKVTYISSQMLQKVEKAKSAEGQGQRNSK